ncbi:uncharacterized protein LOC128884176 isoform X2 [Hylaeus volcanicus]|uniref:uncharacterized protein LOC128884176 isoform X2 n=1 Tax=Hylaeus volcanicus TaxID=313075 RepID=UPI0023B7819B|nr:uncharacterized protein LOC128884176 isoform X2 [Hylaeus volcanicus]
MKHNRFKLQNKNKNAFNTRVNHSKESIVKKTKQITQCEPDLSGLTRGQRKRHEKLERVQRKIHFIQYMESLRALEMKKKKYGAFSQFDDIKDSLNAAAEEMQNKTLNECKKRSKKAENYFIPTECARFKSIHQFKEFQKDPMEAICQHLSNVFKR